MTALRACRRRSALCAFAFGLLLMTAAAVRAQVGGMLVAPTRIVFEGGTSSAALTLVNRGHSEETFQITFVRRTMTEDGRFEVDEGAEGYYADGMVLFSPRQVTLAAGEQQTIRLQLRKPSDLGEGEYRSHLLIRAVPSEGADDVERLLGGRAADEQGLALRMTPVYGLTLPVIVRHGSITATVRIDTLSIAAVDGVETLSVGIARSGQRSVYGNVVVEAVDPDGRERQIGLVNGVAVYTPNTLRTVAVVLDVGERGLSPDTTIRVRYVDREDAQQKVLLAKAEALLSALQSESSVPESVTDRGIGTGREQ